MTDLQRELTAKIEALGVERDEASAAIAQDTEEASRRYVEKRRGDLEQEVVGAGQRNFTPQNSNLTNGFCFILAMNMDQNFTTQFFILSILTIDETTRP